MDNSKQIDFITAQAAVKTKKSFKKIVPTIVVFIILFGIAFTTRAVISSENVAQKFGEASMIEQIKFLVSSRDKTINGEEEGRINVLILGIGGENHSGGMLTDTIIIASLDKTNNKIGLISIPRDLVVPIEGYGWQKINSAHAYGSSLETEDNKGMGIALTKQTIENITGLDIHYYFKIDFDGFKKIVDAIGGVRIDVPIELTDYEYPDNNFGYQTIHFDQGLQTLNGEQALQYARSRHAAGSQGSDFARAKRQQQIIKAFQAKVMALSTLLNPNKLLSIAEIIGKYIETDMQIWELYKLYDTAKDYNVDDVNQVVLSNDEEGLLVSDTSEEGAYILRPRLGYNDFSEIISAAQNLTNPNVSEPTPYVANETEIKVQEPKLNIAVQNGTKHLGLASRTAQNLEALSYNIIQISNAQTQDYEKTVIYKLSDKIIDDQDMQNIRQTLNDANVSPEVPESIQIPDADILIIIGEDNV